MLRLFLCIALCLTGCVLYYIFRKQPVRVPEKSSKDNQGCCARATLVRDPHTGEYHVVRRDSDL